MSGEDILDLETRYLSIENAWRRQYADNERQLKAVTSMREILDQKKQKSFEQYLRILRNTVEYMEISDYSKANGDNY